MQLRFEQLIRQPNPTYRIIDCSTGELVGQANARDINNAQITLYNTEFKLNIPGRKERGDSGDIHDISPITCSDTEVGFVELGFVPTKKILFITTGYDYRIVRLKDLVIKSYEVGFGSGEHYWCIYNDDKLVAMIHKNDVTVNYKNKYRIYTEDAKYASMLCILTLFIDCTEYPDVGECVGLAFQKEGMVTVQKELIAKYDPTFIPRITELDGKLAY